MQGVRGGAAVFGDADAVLGTERLVVVAGTILQSPAARADLEARVARAAVEVFGTAPDRIVLTSPGGLLHTPSGKMRRAAIRDALHAGTLDKPAGPVALQLARFAWSDLEGSWRRLAASIRARAFAAYAWTLTGVIAIPLWGAVQLPVPLRACAGQSPGRRRFEPRRTHGNNSRGRRCHGAPDGPAVIVANHQSFVDGLVLMLASTKPIAFVTSSDLERQVIIGSFLRRIGCEFVVRDHPDQSAESVQRLASVLNAGGNLALFPEGGITRVPGCGPSASVPFAVATSTGSPVVPVGIRGTARHRPTRDIPATTRRNQGRDRPASAAHWGRFHLSDRAARRRSARGSQAVRRA